MDIVLSNAGQTERVDVNLGVDVGHIRTLRDELEDIGVPSSYTFAVNGVGVEDNHILRPGDVVTFRPVSATKGSQ